MSFLPRYVLLVFFAAILFTASAFENLRKLKVYESSGQSPVDTCSSLCESSSVCAGFSLLSNTGGVYNCFLKSQLYISKIEPLLPKNEGELRGLRKKIKIERLVSGPIVTDSTSTLNFQSHFLRGCSYTVSMWVWLYKSKNQLLDNHELVIFTSRPISPPPNGPFEEVLTPSIVFNVGGSPDRMVTN